MNLKRYQVILLAIFVLGIMGITGHMDFQEEERQHAEYCEMVKLWEADQWRTRMASLQRGRHMLMTPKEADEAAQNWRGMDGATAAFD